MERFIKMLCKIRSVICSRISFLVVCLLALFSSFFVSLLTPSPANAYNLGTDYGTVTPNYLYFKVGSTARTCSHKSGQTLVCSLSYTGSDGLMSFRIATNEFINASSIIRVNVRFHTNVLPSIDQLAGFQGSNGWIILDQEITTSSDSGYFVNFSFLMFRPANAGRTSNIEFQTDSYIMGLGSLGATSVSGDFYVNVGNWVGVAGVSTSNIESSLRDILAAINAADIDSAGIISSIQAGNNQAHQDANNQIDATNKTTEAINNQAKEEQDRYEQDKQEEADREEQGNVDANKLGSLFTFNVLNPFIGIFDMFLPSSNCASIPTLARLLHLDNSTVCSWFPNDVRNIVTPVVSLSSSMLLFGFIVRWLDKGNLSGGIELYG